MAGPEQYDEIDLARIRQEHLFKGGEKPKPDEHLWPPATTDGQIKSIAAQALKNNPTGRGYDSGTDMIQATARVNGVLHQFQIKKGTGVLRSSYPVGG